MTKLTGKYLILDSLIGDYSYHEYMAGAYRGKPEGMEHANIAGELARIIHSMLERRSKNHENV